MTIAPSDTSHATGATGAAQHYPPYLSRPAAQSASASAATGTPLQTAPSSAVGVATAGGGGIPDAGHTQDTGRFLQKAEDIEITKADRQEGYDADLVNLPERNTAAAQPRPSIEQQKQRGDPTVPYAANLPYASRALGNENSFESYEDSGGRDSSAKRLSGPGGTTRTGVRHHSSTKRAQSSGPNGRSAYRKSSRRRKRKLAWWERPWFLLLCLVFIVAIGLGVGLVVGLSRANQNKSSDSGGSGSETASPAPGGGPAVEPSQSGATGDGSVQVSVSDNNVAPTETARPRGPDSATPLAPSPTLAPLAAMLEERRRRRMRT